MRQRIDEHRFDEEASESDASSADDQIYNKLAAREFVEVTSGDRMLTVLLAEGDEGLVLASRNENHAGIYSTGFAACRAIVLQSDNHVALAHTSTVTDEVDENGVGEFSNVVEACRALFIRYAGVEPRVSVGYSLRGRQGECEDHREFGGRTVQEMMADQLGSDPTIDFGRFKALAADATEDEQWETAIQCVVAQELKTITEWSKATKTRVFDMPQEGLLVPLRGNEIELYSAGFEEEPASPPKEK